MNAARSFALIALMVLALSGSQNSFGQAPPAPAGAGGAAPIPLSADAPQPLPAAGAQPQPAAGAQPVAADAPQPLPAAPVQPLPVAQVQPDPAAAAQPFPPAGIQPFPPAGIQTVPVPGVPNLSLTRGSHIIGSRAILVGGVPIGTVQDMLSVAGSGEYLLVANPSGFVTIPQSLTIFEPGPRILQVNMTFAQVGELPRLLQLGQLNRPFLQQVHTFFQSPRGAAILRNNSVRNVRSRRPPGGVERRVETRTVSKPAVRPQIRTERRPENGTEIRR